MRKWLWAVLLVTLALAVAACGDDDDDDGGDAQAPSGDTSQASGDVAWCIGKDTTGAYGTAIDLFKKENPKVTVNLVELPESADEQRTQLVQRLDAESDECDVLGMDVIWTAEFAAQEWLQDTSDIIEPRQDDFIASTLETAQYEDKYWAVPYHTNAGFLYYRTDQVQQSPETWEDVYAEAGQNNGIVYQGARYEGLTVNFLELLYSGGGAVLSEDGSEAQVSSPEGEAALEFMAAGVQEGDAPKAVTTYMEEESRRAFENGNATFMRNWPYAYALGKESKIADDFEVGTFPGFNDGEPAGVLGGINLAISAYSTNPEGAAAFINFATGPEVAEGELPGVGVTAGDRRRLRRPGGPEEVRLRLRPEGGRRAGPGAAGVAGLLADQRGDLQQRPRRAAGQRRAAGRLGQDAVGHPEGTRDVLGARPWKPRL